MRTLWIARNKDNSLFIFNFEPFLQGNRWIVDIGWTVQVEMGKYPEVTFENSPKRLVVESDEQK